MLSHEAIIKYTNHTMQVVYPQEVLVFVILEFNRTVCNLKLFLLDYRTFSLWCNNKLSVNKQIKVTIVLNQ